MGANFFSQGSKKTSWINYTRNKIVRTLFSPRIVALYLFFFTYKLEVTFLRTFVVHARALWKIKICEIL